MDRERVLRALRVVQGHPKLLELADAAAALSEWKTSALDVLPEPVRLLAQFLACLEDDDRQSGATGMA